MATSHNINNYNELFKYKDSNSVSKPASLASTVISAYDNNISDNIHELIDVLNNKDSDINTKNRNPFKKKILNTIKETNNLENNLTPDDSISNIGGLNPISNFDSLLNNIKKC